MEGLANGSVYLRDFYNKFNADATIKAEQFRLDDDSIGVVTLGANYNNESGKINFNYKSENDHYAFNGNGYYNIKDTINTPFSTTMHLLNTKIGLVNEFLGNIFSGIVGEATGDLTIQGDPESPD